MENKDWENFVNDLNGDLRPEENTSSVSASSGNNHELKSPSTPDDDLLKERLSGYSPSASIEGWDKIASSLDAADEVFDQQVRNRIHQYHPAFDPHSWPKFAKRFSAHKQLRTRLIVLKLSEAAAILLLVFTLLQLSREGRSPFEETIAEETSSALPQNQPMATVESKSGPIEKINVGLNMTTTKSEHHSKTLLQTTTKSHSASPIQKAGEQIVTELSPENSSSVIEYVTSNFDPVITISEVDETLNTFLIEQPTATIDESANQSDRSSNPTTLFLSQPVPSITYEAASPIQKPILVATSGKSFLEFGMLVQADYNQLKMPEDRLNSDGKQIVFPLQGISSPGYGAGITLAVGYPRWTFETGLIYNTKTFKPGRELTIGSEADNSKVEYEAMHMQLISVPLQARYRFDNKGRFKTYVLAGFGLHVIAQSDIDVKVAYNFPSLPEGENPNNNPSLARTIRQTQRVSEDIRERAPFSTNSYISANLGLGIEYSLVERKTLFLQTAYQYQIPNLRFSNHNGKHVLSLSLQAGVRTPLGL